MSTSDATTAFRPLATSNGGGDGGKAGAAGAAGSTSATAAAKPTSSSATSIYNPSSLATATKVENNNSSSNNTTIVIGNPQPPITLDSVDFMNYLATEIDISKLVVETKDGQRISANFSGSRFPDGVATPPPVSVFKSLDALRSIDSTIAVDNDAASITNAATNNKKTTTTTPVPPPAVETGTVLGDQPYLQPLKAAAGGGGGGADGGGTNDTNTVSTTEPPMPGNGSLSRLSSVGTLGSWDPFASSDWSREYGGTHVEVKYTSAFDLKSTDFLTAGGPAGRGRTATSSAAAVGHPKKRSEKNGNSTTAPTTSVSRREGEGMFLDPKFDNSLNPLLVAAARMADQSASSRSTDHGVGGMANGMNRIGGIPVVSATTANGVTGYNNPRTATGLYTVAQEQYKKSQQESRRARKRKSRKIIPKVKEYVVFTEQDVLFGRGGRSNHHPGNKSYRDLVTSKQPYYRTCEKTVKTQVAQSIVDHVQQKFGGRFLELDRETDQWYVVPNIVARRKVGQALREDNTAEARAVKRQKYLGKFKTAGASQPSTVSNGNSTATPNKAGSALAATTKV